MFTCIAVNSRCISLLGVWRPYEAQKIEGNIILWYSNRDELMINIIQKLSSSCPTTYEHCNIAWRSELAGGQNKEATSESITNV